MLCISQGLSLIPFSRQVQQCSRWTWVEVTNQSGCSSGTGKKAGEKRGGEKKKSLKASSSPSCLLLETLLGSWPPCSSASLQKPWQEKKHGRVEKITEEAEEMTKLLKWETSEEGYVCREIWIYLCCVALSVMPDFTWQLPSISRFQAERRMRHVELEYPKALPPKEWKIVQKVQKWRISFSYWSYFKQEGCCWSCLLN